MLKLFGLGGSSKDSSDSGSGPKNGNAADLKSHTSGKKAVKQKINQKLEDAFKADFEDEEETNAQSPAQSQTDPS